MVPWNNKLCTANLGRLKEGIASLLQIKPEFKPDLQEDE